MEFDEKDHQDPDMTLVATFDIGAVLTVLRILRTVRVECHAKQAS